MNLRLFTGPSRSAILTELFRRLPIGTGRICAIVPDSESAHRLENLIVKQCGGAALGARVYTFDRLSQDICAHDRIPPAIIPVHLKRALIRELISSRIGSDSHWLPIAGSPGFASLVSSYLEDIRSGITDNSEDPDLAAISRAYESHLNRLGKIDHEGYIRLALAGDAVERFAASFDGPLVIEGFYDLTPCQFELAARLVSTFRRSAVCVVNDTGRPGLFSLPAALIERFGELGGEVTEVPSLPSSPCDRVLASFMNGQELSPESNVSDNDIAIHTFRSVSAEADWVAGTIFTLVTNGQYAPRNIMVVTRQTPVEGHPIVTMLHRHGIPVQNGVTRPLATHPLATCIIAALEASINPTEEALTAVRRSSYTLPNIPSDSSLLPDTDIRGWSSMIADTDSPAGFAESMLRMIDALGIGKAIMSDDFMESDRTAYDLMLRSLEEFAAFYRPLRPMMGAHEYCRLFRRFIAEVQLRDTGSDSGVLLAGIMHARYADRPIVFMTGLDNSSYPSPHDRFVLHSYETASALATRREHEEPLLFLSAMSGAKRLYLSYPGVDDEGDDAGMSPYLRELIDRAGADDRINRHTGIPGAAWEGGASTRRGKLEETVRLLNTPDGGRIIRGLVLRHPKDARLLRDAFARFSVTTLHNGYRLLQPSSLALIARSWSDRTALPVTAIEQYRNCPIAFFFQRLLAVEVTAPPDDSLDGSERGSIVHDTLARFFTVLADTTGSTRLSHNDLEQAFTIMDHAVDDVFMKWRHKLKRLNPLVLAAERQLIKRWMNEIVRIEADLQSVSLYLPFRFEEPFGTKNSTPLVVEADGETLALRGRIDRIDRAPGNPPRFRIIDYKTGRAPAKRELETGDAIQLPLYMKAVSEILYPGSEVDEGIYFTLSTAEFNTDKGQLSGCISVGDDDIEAVTGAAIQSAVEAVRNIRSGVFSAPETCNRFCDFKPLCRGGMTQLEGDAYADR